MKLRQRSGPDWRLTDKGEAVESARAHAGGRRNEKAAALTVAQERLHAVWSNFAHELLSVPTAFDMEHEQEVCVG